MTYFAKYPFYANDLRFEKGQKLTSDEYELALSTNNLENLQVEGIIPDSFLSLEELRVKKAELDALISSKELELEATQSTDEVKDEPISNQNVKAKK